MTQGPRTVLVVEDEAVLRSSMVGGLGKLDGITVLSAGTLSEAIATLAARQPDLLVSDIDLPDGLGVQLIGELSKRGIRAPILFVTAYRAAYGTLIPPHANVEIMEKPLSLDALRQAVLRLLGEEPVSSPFTVADYVQLSCMGRHSVAIEIAGAFGRGRVEVVRGELWSAADDLGSGTEAFRRVAFRRDARIGCAALEQAPGARNIEDSWEGVLMECARLDDEERRHDAPAADAGDEDWGFGVEITKPSIPFPGEEEPAPAFEPVDEFGAVYDRAIEALLKKDYPRALSELRRARELRPDDHAVSANLKRLAELGYSESNA